MDEKTPSVAALTDILKAGPKSNKEIRQLLHLDTGRHDPILDRTLQKLRKEGKVKVSGGKWIIDEFEVCEHCAGRGWVTKKGKK